MSPTDTELLNQIIDIVFKCYNNEYDWDKDGFGCIFNLVNDTDYFNQLIEKDKVYQQKRKIKKLKNIQKRVEEEAQRLMIELQQLEDELK